MNKTNAMRVRLTDERKADILSRLTSLYATEFDEKLSPFRADQILTFFLQHLGPAVYNQAIQDARKYMSERLDDLDATFYAEAPTGKQGCRPAAQPRVQRLFDGGEEAVGVHVQDGAVVVDPVHGATVADSACRA